MDLDDDELKATRKLNGVDKERDIEKDIKRCEELTKPEHANWIGISSQLAIAHIVDRIKELEKENRIIEFKNKQVENYVEELKKYNKTISDRIVEYKKDSISKQKVKDFINKLKLSGGSNGKDNVENLVRELAIEILEELLEDE